MLRAFGKDWYTASDFARLARISVRTLHYYDRLGLLKPKTRSSAGYRLYHRTQLEQVEQIVALKFLSLPLKEIRLVLARDSLSLADALSRQRFGLIEKRRLLDRALAALDEAEIAIRQRQPTDRLLRKIIEVIKMQNDARWLMRYYSPDAQAKIAERAKSFTPEMQDRVSQAWSEYFRDLAALQTQEDPEGSKARELSQRHQSLVAEFTGNDPEVEAGLKALYKDHVNWPDEMRERLKQYHFS